MDHQPRRDDYAQASCWSTVYHRDRVAPPYELVTGHAVLSSAVVVVVAVAVEDGVCLASRPPARRVDNEHCPESDLGRSLYLRGRISGVIEPQTGVTERALMDEFAAKVLVVPSSTRWREAMSTALLGDWSDPLVQTGHLSDTAVGILRAEARSLHRDLTPLWRRGTRHGRVLSLDANLGDGLSFYDLVAADIDLLARVTGGVIEDDRLNRVLRGLAPAERATVFTYAEHKGTTWTEAAAAAGAGGTDPGGFGERVRRKVKRLAAEQARRTAMVRTVRDSDQHFSPDADAP
ncbi:hypothetical protein [Streptomyces europaeiscabiei]|uniref:hypothetical protein n=1 Tax=Streptomyces europaeiscabiei TaxID=146819 RepID=UPI000E679E84|nr:hypothetical protein [Streptomyces europaeiscabiei]MDX3696921.1 hypothetical protein [Streptomyces europaeiscabiei]